MHTHTLAGVPALTDDCLLLATLKRVTSADLAVTRPRRIGICGPDGRVYRVLVYDHARERRALVSVLHKLGFAAEPCEVGMTVFRRPATAQRTPVLSPTAA